MDRIAWNDPALSGELFEKIAACLLGIEHPKAVRVLPSKGDGGVDIFVPVGPGQIDVYQVKYFPNRIGWPKVEASLTRLEEGEWLGRSVRDWYLVVPKQPTRERIKRLDELGEGVPFEVSWFGEDRLARLAMKYPEVGEYYLGDGRAQLARSIADWASVTDRIAEGHAPRFADVRDRLAEIATAMGRSDPHLRYGLEVLPATGDGSNPFAGVSPQDGALGAQAVIVDDQVVVCHVHPRYLAAVDDAADRLTLGLALTQEAGRRLDEVLRLGGDTITLQEGEIVGLSMPEAFGGGDTEGVFEGRLTPLSDTSPALLRLVVDVDGGRTVHRFRRVKLTTGSDGATSEWLSPTGCVSLHIVADHLSNNLSMRVDAIDLGGRPIADVVPDIGLMRLLRAGAAVSISAGAGPLEAGEPRTLPVDAVDPQMIDLLDALRVIQDHTTTEVVVPTTPTSRAQRQAVRCAAFLEGIPTTSPMPQDAGNVFLPRDSLSAGSDHDVFGGLFALGESRPVGPVIQVGHQEVDVGRELTAVRVHRSVTVASITDAPPEVGDDFVEIALAAGPLNFMIETRIDTAEDFTDGVQAGLVAIAAPIPIGEVSRLLACRGQEPTA